MTTDVGKFNKEEQTYFKRLEAESILQRIHIRERCDFV